jgi:hypothetical protein
MLILLFVFHNLINPLLAVFKVLPAAQADPLYSSELLTPGVASPVSPPNAKAAV